MLHRRCVQEVCEVDHADELTCLQPRNQCGGLLYVRLHRLGQFAEETEGSAGSGDGKWGRVGGIGTAVTQRASLGCRCCGKLTCRTIGCGQGDAAVGGGAGGGSSAML